MKNLEQSLLNAKKFMEHEAMNKSGRAPRTNTNIQTESVNVPPQMSHNIPTPSTPNMNPKANMSEESIRNSKLPDAIKQAMIDNPIPDVSPTPNLSESFMDKVSQKMNSEQYSVQNMRTTANSNVGKINIPTKNVVKESKDPIPSPFETPSVDSDLLKDTIKECIKEIMVEENILMESKNIKENLQIRVGNKIFTGNIKSIKSIKSTKK